MSNEIGYYEEPRDDNGIIRARTSKNIRSRELPRTMRSLEALNDDYMGVEFPSIYTLFESKSKVYVGEAKNVYNRLKTHITSPEDKIKDWYKAIVINDGRPATQSDFNDTVVRKALEYYLIKLFRANKYTVVSRGERQKLNALQKFLVDSLKRELDFFLLKKNVISKFLDEPGQEEVFDDELIEILERTGREIQKWGSYEAVIDNENVFIRRGSKKTKGWQITFRDIFKDSLQKGNGYLLMPRNGVLLIPLTEVQKVIRDKTTYEQNTIDVWIVFTEDKVTLSYKNNTIDITKFKLIDRI